MTHAAISIVAAVAAILTGAAVVTVIHIVLEVRRRQVREHEEALRAVMQIEQLEQQLQQEKDELSQASEPPLRIVGAVIEPNLQRIVAVVLLQAPSQAGTKLVVRTHGRFRFYEQNTDDTFKSLTVEAPE